MGEDDAQQNEAQKLVPEKIVWENDDAIAFHDVNPQAPVHVLIVPKKVIPRLAEATEADSATLGNLLLAAAEIAADHELGPQCNL